MTDLKIIMRIARTDLAILFYSPIAWFILIVFSFLTTASFTSYAEADFNDKEQRELGAFVDGITAKKAKVVISNSDPKNSDEDDTFFDDLYGRYNILRVTAKRMINCNGESRGNVSELLISNY